MKAARSKPYYGWYLAITLAVTETISWGVIYYTFSVLLTPMEQDLGWSRSELTAGFSLMWLVAGGMAFPVGSWIDKHGARLLMTVGSIGAAVLVIAWSLVTSLTAYYLVWVGLGICAAAVLYEPAFAVITQWFHKKRSTALAVVTFAAGLSSTIFLPLADALVHGFGWRASLVVLAVFMAVLTIPLHAFMLRRRPADLGLQIDGESRPAEGNPVSRQGVSLRVALNGRAFWLLTLAFGLISLAAAAIRVHFIPYLIENGIGSSNAALATGAIGIMQVVGRVIFAPLDQRFSVRAMLIAVFGLHVVALALLLPPQSVLVIGAFVVLFGVAQGAVTLARPSIVASLYGITHYGRISSMMALFLTVTSTAAPLGASLLYEQFGNYRPVLWAVMVLALAATGVVLLMNRDADRQE